MAEHRDDEVERLTSAEDWSKVWKSRRGHALSFDPTLPAFQMRHALLQQHLPVGPQVRTLEIGAFPGRFLWYFHAFFGHSVAGVELVPDCADAMREDLAAVGIPATIYSGDVFELKIPDDERYDVVASFGFVEHFEDPIPVVRRHLDLLRPGGLLVLCIPNHAGVNGQVMRLARPDLYPLHNLMSFEDLRDAVLATGQADVVGGGYDGRFNLWNTGLYHRAREAGRLAQAAVRLPLVPVERALRRLPPSKLFSPSASLVARKR